MRIDRRRARRIVPLIVGVAIVVTAVAAPVAGATARGCGLLGLFPCPKPAAVAAVPAAPPTVNADGSLILTPDENPAGLTPYPPRVPGGPLYPLVRGRLPYGLMDNDSTSNIAGTATSAQIAAEAAAVGATWVKVNLSWPMVEPSSGSFSFAYYDKVYKAYVAAGVRPVFMLMSTPAWAVDWINTYNYCSGNYCTIEPSTSKLGALSALGAQLAKRYPLTAGMEYRNEPDIAQSNGQVIDPKVYAKDLNYYASGIHSARPAIRVWGGSLVPRYSAPAYLKDFFAAGGAANIDALSFHPYPIECDYTAINVNQMKYITDPVAAAGLTNSLRLIASETGVPRDGGYGGCTFSDGPKGTGESTFQRLKRFYDDIDRHDPTAPVSNPPLDGTGRIDGIVFYTAVDTPSGLNFGWVKRPVGTADRVPTDLFCRWRHEVFGLGAFPGGSGIGACPALTRATRRPASRRARALHRASAR